MSVNVTLGGGKAVHRGTEVEGYMAWPSCGGNKAGERYSETTAEVTCKRCLKAMAAEAEAAERTAYYAGLAEQQDNFGSQATPAAEAQQPEAEPVKARQVSVDMQSETQGVALVHGTDGFQGLIGADGDGGFYAENPYANAMWHRDGFGSVTAAADGLARSDGFAGTVRITVTREYGDAVPVTSTTEADPSRVAGDAEEDVLAAALSSAGIVFTPEQLSAAATTLTAQQPAAPLAARVMSAIDLGDAEWLACDNGPEAESTALRTIEAIRQLVTPGSKMQLPEPPAATEVRIVMNSDSVVSAWLNGTEYVVFCGLSSWGVVGTGIRGNSLDGIGKALARRLGITGPVTTTVVPPLV